MFPSDNYLLKFHYNIVWKTSMYLFFMYGLSCAIYTIKGNRSKLAPDYGANDVKKSFKLLELIEVLHSVAKL